MQHEVIGKKLNSHGKPNQSDILIIGWLVILNPLELIFILSAELFHRQQQQTSLT